MSRFLTALRVEQIEDRSHDGRGTWRLLEPLLYESTVARGLISVPAGFVTDFASVPRVPFAYWIAGDTAHKAAVVHDFLYTAHRIGSRVIERALADQVLREAADLTDCLPPNGRPDTDRYNAEVRRRNALMYWAVRLFGGSHWDAPGPVQPPSVAPFANPAA